MIDGPADVVYLILVDAALAGVDWYAVDDRACLDQTRDILAEVGGAEYLEMISVDGDTWGWIR